MNRLIYFIPTSKQGASEADVIAAGLGYALDGGGIGTAQTTRGPGDLEGLLIVIGRNGESSASPPAYDPANQIWRKHPGGGYFVGLRKDARPGPDDLVRERVYEGQRVKLLDGNEWELPRCLAMLPERSPSLPRVLDLDEQGRPITRTHPRYEALCAAAWRCWEDFSGRSKEGERLGGQQQVELAVDALAVNYRLGKIEAVGLLGLLGTDEVGLILRAIVDADEVDRYIAAKAENVTVEGEGEGAATPANPT